MNPVICSVLLAGAAFAARGAAAGAEEAADMEEFLENAEKRHRGAVRGGAGRAFAPKDTIPLPIITVYRLSQRAEEPVSCFSNRQSDRAYPGTPRRHAVWPGGILSSGSSWPTWPGQNRIHAKGSTALIDSVRHAGELELMEFALRWLLWEKSRALPWEESRAPLKYHTHKAGHC